MNNNELISIIIPVYNVSNFIEKTITSLLNQDYRNIEIILVNDGSTDDSAKKCDNMSKKDQRIKVLHKQNGGVSSARNAGLEIANGKYVMFVDGDDYVDSNYVSFFHDEIKKSGAEICVNYSNYGIETQKTNTPQKETIISAEKAIIDIFTSTINVAVWNKIYDTSVIKKNHLSFDERIWFGEGMLFNIKYLSLTKKVATVSKNVYHQVYNTDSAMRKFNMASRKNGIESIKLQQEILKNSSKKVKNSIKYHLKCTYMSILIQILKNNAKETYKEEYKKCIKEIRKNFSIILKIDIPLKKKIFYLLATLSPVLMAKRVIYKEKALLKGIAS